MIEHRPEEQEEWRLITCVLHSQKGIELLKALHRRGLNAAAVHHARGAAIADPAGASGLPVSFEKEIVTVVVPASSAEAIFAFVAQTAEIDRPQGGLLYMERLGKAVPYVLPDIPEEESA
ncbi:MAG: hypothetical protein FJ398_15030 [Verrucomicrobia bacterium]|nr:hypothetical protein [Verrucomicrobiota bacterium]